MSLRMKESCFEKWNYRMLCSTLEVIICGHVFQIFGQIDPIPHPFSLCAPETVEQALYPDVPTTTFSFPVRLC